MNECVICGSETTKHRIRRVELGRGNWTNLFADVDIGPGADSLKLLAYGDGVAEYEPKFCPECGRRVNNDI